MSDVFVSYKREDEIRVARLVRALEKQGLSVWWDRGLAGGEHWRTGIEAALEAARCVVVVWTCNSVGAQGGFVKDEAGRGAARGLLVPVLMDKVQPPLGFGELQAIDLARWRGSTRDPFFQDLVAAIRAKLEGRPVPASKGPMRRLLNRLLAGGLASAALVAGGAFANNTLNLQNQICGMGKGLSDTCGALGLGSRPERAERLAWAQRPRGDCNALRTHIQRFPEGAYRATADALINARQVSAVEQWTPVQRPLTLHVGRDVPPSASEAAARGAALERARSKAERLCRDFLATGLFRYRGADANAREWNCTSVHGGVVCELEGLALCDLEEGKAVPYERCDAPVNDGGRF